MFTFAPIQITSRELKKNIPSSLIGTFFLLMLMRSVGKNSVKK